MVDGQKMTRHKKRRHDEVHHVGQARHLISCKVHEVRWVTCITSFTLRLLTLHAEH